MRHAHGFKIASIDRDYTMAMDFNENGGFALLAPNHMDLRDCMNGPSALTSEALLVYLVEPESRGPGPICA